MSLRIGDFWKFKHFIKPFEKLFSELEADDSADAQEDIASLSGQDAKEKSKAKAKANQQKQKEQALAKQQRSRGRISTASGTASVADSVHVA